MHRHIASILSLIIAISAAAQSDTIRYVLCSGSFTNDGRSWASAKNNVQDAINDLQDYLTRNNLPSGSVYVGAGVYRPTESTEATGGSILHTAFKIPAGVSVYGGFSATGRHNGREQRAPGDRIMANGLTQADNERRGSAGSEPIDGKACAWDFHPDCATYLSGNHNSSTQLDGYLQWDSNRQQYTESYPGNSYHVVWFGTNGVIPSDDSRTQGHYAPLSRTAVVDGFIITGGYAAQQQLDERHHSAFGGGAYLVKGAVVRNCQIRENAAMRRGGGVYLDGGGLVDHCLIQHNQAKGIGLIDGYGGGVAIDHVGTLRHSIITDNGASIGAGVAIDHTPEYYPQSGKGEALFANAFAPIVTACAIANNTATTEGGGIAMIGGGVANHLTIVRNHCAGSNIVSNGRRYGNAGGLYIDLGAVLFNSVVWGNTTKSSGNSQYSAYVPTTATAAEVRPYINFSAFSNHDDSDWTGTDKQEVVPLQTANRRSESGRDASDYYADFTAPAALSPWGIAGVETDQQPLAVISTAWVPASHSDLVGRGIRLADYLTKRSSDMLNATVDVDLYGRPLSPTSTLGAFVEASIDQCIVPNTEVEPLDPVPDGAPVVTLFVDPEFKSGIDAGASLGANWCNPLTLLADALHYIKQCQARQPGDNTIYQVLVKEGTSLVSSRRGSAPAAGKGAGHERLRDLSIAMAPNVRLYGGFYGSLGLIPAYRDPAGISVRDPMAFPSVITASKPGLDYNYNSAHVVSFSHVDNAWLDGFNICNGNTTIDQNLNSAWAPMQPSGAGIIITGGNNNVIRNCQISNCIADSGHGAAIMADATTALLLENLAIYNNSSYAPDDRHSAVAVTGRATVTMDHCLLHANIGALRASGYGTLVTVRNSAFHANAAPQLEGIKAEGYELAYEPELPSLLMGPIVADGAAWVNCDANMTDAELPPQLGFTPMFTHLLTENPDFTYPRFANATTYIGASPAGLTTYYGGNPDFTPGNMNPMVNMASDTSTQATDMTTATTRSQGGRADIGPIENADLPPRGQVAYVRTSGSDDNDGLSWGSPKRSITAALHVPGIAEVWVGAGTYTENVVMVEGIDIYGGFIAAGNPGNNIGDPTKDMEVERSLANVNPPQGEAPDPYNTVIDGNQAGRPLTQTADFGVETTVEGFSLTRGRVTNLDDGGGAKIMGAGVLKNCLVFGNTYYASVNNNRHGGGGLYTTAGSMVKNCIIRNNLAHAENITQNAVLTLGGGALIAGGTFINSMIVDNELRTTRGGTSQLGAAVYVSGATDFYSCTLAFNFGNNTSRGGATAGGVWDDSRGASRFFNCIFWGNYGNGTSRENFYPVTISGISQNRNLFNCYQSAWYKGAANVGAGEDEDDPSLIYLMDGSANVNTWEQYRDACYENSPFVDPRNGNYELKAPAYGSLSINCINRGKYEEELADKDVTEDIKGNPRIQDCTLDKGAYEYDGSREITPLVELVDGRESLIFYVTERGDGLASAQGPQNAACAKKLQLVLDAAGRYKYSNPDCPVVVRLGQYERIDGEGNVHGYAPVDELMYDDFGNELHYGSAFNPLAYSILVPRGVTLEGGWNPQFTDRDPLQYRTVLTGCYEVSKNTYSNVYHVVSFTDMLYDASRRPYFVDEDDGSRLLRLDSDHYGRAVVDGVFITGGNAIGQDDERINSAFARFAIGYQRIDSYYSPDNYGGAAIVPSYAHIRNCVIEGNKAAAGGGALMLKPRALVSGCILRNNSTSGNGGAVFVYEPKTDINDFGPGVYLPLCDDDALDPSLDPSRPAVAGPEYRFANIFTSTIVNNTAKKSGGGVYFSTNLRMNSSLLWRNNANSNANISGLISPGRNADTDLAPWEYPLQYCALENQRAAGYNNVSVASESSKGTRWNWTAPDPNDDSDAALLTDDIFYFDPKRYSMLTRSGMSMGDYATLVQGFDLEGATRHYDYFPTLESRDIAGALRTAHQVNKYIEIGARALDADIHTDLTPDNLMRRIFVAMPEDTNLDCAELMEGATATQTQANCEYYRQQGSSMAFPMNRLDDALEYIRDARLTALSLSQQPGLTTAESELLATLRYARFEIFMAGGTYYPYRTIDGNSSDTRSNTFLVPEGVAIYGGIDPADYSLCAMADPSLGDIAISDDSRTIVLKPRSTSQILDSRLRYDINHNGIIEGWGLQQQTILSGHVVNAPNTRYAYHVVTAIADERYVGLLPEPTLERADYDGTECKQRGLPIVIDGVQITQGEALAYTSSEAAADLGLGGAAVRIDGNWLDADRHLHMGASAPEQTVGYRNIPLTLRNCLVTNNSSCHGGAIYTNGDLSIYSSQLAQNTATPDLAALPDGAMACGGAVYGAARIICANSIFANNSASPAQGQVGSGTPTAVGAAIAVGPNGALEVINCNIVNNQAQAYPAIYACRPNMGYGSADDSHFGRADNPHLVLNSIFWGNEATAQGDLRYNWLLNTPADARYPRPEALWFCAYEPDAWHEPRQPAATGIADDFRQIPYPAATQAAFVPEILRSVYDRAKYPDIDRCNLCININADNGRSDGPNFINPSTRPGASGYTPSADWMIGRINNLVDQGWSCLPQTFSEGYDAAFTDLDGSGPYVALAARANSDAICCDAICCAPIKDNPYMRYNATSDDDSRVFMRRISLDPHPASTLAYIDIGAYEYQHTTLNITSGRGVDVLWVTEHERLDVGDTDGSTWEKATSDLQRAIETLLASRNDHKKEIRMLSGEYMPVYTINGALAFNISTGPQDAHVQGLPSDIEPEHPDGYGVRSLTIRGGYNAAVKGQFDPTQFPTVLAVAQRAGAADELLQHILVIDDARQRVTIAKAGESQPTSTALGCTVPIILEGLTFVNGQASEIGAPGSAIRYNDHAGVGAPQTPGADIMPKLTISHCKFEYNGQAAPVPGNSHAAVYVGTGGGQALMHNSLWHHNAGASVEGPGPTNIVNCTFALNGGPVMLSPDSKLSNSILWRNGATEIAGIAPDSPNISYNAISGTASDQDDSNHNSYLSDDNDDVLYGPNFNDPGLDDFSVLPSVPVTGRAAADIYISDALGLSGDAAQLLEEGHAAHQSIYTDQELGGCSSEFVHDARYLAYRDLEGNIRYYDGGLDRGAYECQAVLDRVMYVLPNIDEGDNGRSWAQAYGRRQLQSAINAGSVYSHSHSHGDDKKYAYIFVRGSNAFNMADIVLRDGVQLYGSIQSQFVDEAQPNADGTYDDAMLDEYVAQVRNHPLRAMASPSTQRSVISGLTAVAGATAVLDGFDIAPIGSATIASAPIVAHHDCQALVLRNCIIHGYDMAPGAPVADLAGGALLYNCLVRDNNAPISLSSGAWLLHTTLATDAQGLSSGIAAQSGAADHALNSIDHCGMRLSGPFADYFCYDPADSYHGDSRFAQMRNYHNLWYQLSEASQHINRGASDNLLAYGPGKITDRRLPVALQPFVDMGSDRDLLGNPRIVCSVGAGLGGMTPDYGCFETWAAGSPGAPMGSRESLSVLAPTRNAALYGGNYYPHEGSVAYIHPDGAIALDNATGCGFDSDNPFRPAFLLLREGGSLYGRGNVVQLSYVALERQMHGRYNMVALPFDFKIKRNGGCLSTIASIDYGHQPQARAIGADMYLYDGALRARWNYKFNGDDSDCWQPLALSHDSDSICLGAAQGWLMDLGAQPDQPVTVRFTAYGTGLLNWVYREDGSNDVYGHRVPLLQHDDRSSTNGGADFTHEYNMGWNLVGLPYLVSDYYTGPMADGDYAMNVPHIAYSLLANGSYATSRSWDPEARLTAGHAFFTQTATLADKEMLAFAQPHLAMGSSTGARAMRVGISRGHEDDIDDAIVIASASDHGHLGYLLGSDGAKLAALEQSIAQIYAIGTEALRLSLLGHAPTDVDIPLGIDAPEPGQYRLSLPDDCRISPSGVWIIDRELGQSHDLTASDYVAAIGESGPCIGRFYLRISDQQPSSAATEPHYDIHLRDGVLTIEGLTPGDRIGVHTIDGITLATATATATTWMHPVRPAPVYIIVINTVATKLITH